MMPVIFSMILGIILLLLLVHGLVSGSIGMKLLCGLIIGVLLFGLIPLHPPGRARERALRAICMNNLRQISLATKAFQKEHANQCPATLQDLTNAFPYPKGYICRSTGHQPGALTNVNQWTDYFFVSQPGTNGVLAYCPPDNHKGEGGNIVLVDGSVLWFKANEFLEALKHERRGLPLTASNSTVSPASKAVQR